MKKGKLTIKAAFGKIHLWLGLLSGLVIFTVAITGAIYVFSDDIINVTEQSFTRVKIVSNNRLSPSQLTDIAQRERRRFLGTKQIPAWDWATLYIYKEADRAVRFSSRHYKDPNQFVDVFLDPYSGQVLKTRDTYAYPFWDFIIELHTSLLLGDVGTYIVEISTLVFLAMLITGIVLWWPKNKAATRQRIWFRWKRGLKWKRRNYDLHNILGFYASWIVLFMIITGLGWSFGWFRTAIGAALLSPPPAEQNLLVKFQPSLTDTVLTPIDRIFQTVYQMDPHAASYHLNYATKENQPFNVYVQLTRNWAPGNDYSFDPSTGSLLAKKLYKDLSRGEKYDLMAGDIHYGWIFGWPSKILTFIACLIAASLPITGFYIWLGRNKRKKIRMTDNP